MPQTFFSHKACPDWELPLVMHLHNGNICMEDTDVTAGGIIVKTENNIGDGSTIYLLIPDTSRYNTPRRPGDHVSSHIKAGPTCTFVGSLVDAEKRSRSNLTYSLIKLETYRRPPSSISSNTPRIARIPQTALFREHATLPVSLFSDQTPIGIRTHKNQIVRGHVVHNLVNIRPSDGSPISHAAVSIVKFDKPLPGGSEGLWVYAPAQGKEWPSSDRVEWKVVRPTKKQTELVDALCPRCDESEEWHLKRVGMVIGVLEKAPCMVVLRPIQHIVEDLLARSQDQDLVIKNADADLIDNVIQVPDRGLVPAMQVSGTRGRAKATTNGSTSSTWEMGGLRNFIAIRGILFGSFWDWI
ncbi:hypothetical protein F5Y15DRAFT_403154 [Xylariaceae sp. FL0016]|nr:hypothetical protein F5Y15DRAFT_403154 [Xylariaceae sp. FL0016]